MEGDDLAQESFLLRKQGSLKDAVFGVLFTITKEHEEGSWKWGVLGMIIGFLQARGKGAAASKLSKLPWAKTCTQPHPNPRPFTSSPAAGHTDHEPLQLGL